MKPREKLCHCQMAVPAWNPIWLVFTWTTRSKLRLQPVQIWTLISVNLTMKSRSPAETLEKYSIRKGPPGRGEASGFGPWRWKLSQGVSKEIITGIATNCFNKLLQGLAGCLRSFLDGSRTTWNSGSATSLSGILEGLLAFAPLQRSFD